MREGISLAELLCISMAELSQGVFGKWFVFNTFFHRQNLDEKGASDPASSEIHTICHPLP